MNLFELFGAAGMIGGGAAGAAIGSKFGTAGLLIGGLLGGVGGVAGGIALALLAIVVGHLEYKLRKKISRAATDDGSSADGTSVPGSKR